MNIQSMETPGRVKTEPETSAAAGFASGGPGFRLKKILVPTDFSDGSAKAVDYALAFAQPSGAEIILLHMVEPISYPIYGQEIVADWSDIQTDLLQASRERLAEFSQARAAGYGPLKQLISEGTACSGILETARSEAVDLIILSTHGRTGIRHALLGSNTERVVRHAPCPVLTVRERETEFINRPSYGTHLK
jgi:nucleotide-binding universal stress UspA family protein